MLYLNIFLMFSYLVQGCIASSDSTVKESSLSKFTGEALVDMGIKLNKPLLKLLGKTVSRLEHEIKEEYSSSTIVKDVVAEMCRLHPCSEWSEWSKCDANHLGDFGGQTRSRNCGVNTTLCKHYETPFVAHDTRVCALQCPKNYTSTGHDFCLKFYDKKMIRDDAEKVCQSDGGHLVNVDSDIKVKYVNETIKAYTGSNVWIDGRRLKHSDNFTFGYKSADPSFTFWGDNDPDNGADDLCIMYLKSSATSYFWRWFDAACSNLRPFICQYQYR